MTISSLPKWWGLRLNAQEERLVANVLLITFTILLSSKVWQPGWLEDFKELYEVTPLTIWHVFVIQDWGGFVKFSKGRPAHCWQLQTCSYFP